MFAQTRFMRHETESYKSVNHNAYGAITSLQPKLKGNSKEAKVYQTVFSYQTSAQLYFFNQWLTDVLAPFVNVSLRYQSQRHFPWKIIQEKHDIISFLNTMINSIKSNDDKLMHTDIQHICQYSKKFATIFNNLNDNDKTIEIPLNDSLKLQLALTSIKYASKNYCVHCESAYGFMVQCELCEQWVHPGKDCENDRRNESTLKNKNVKYFCKKCRQSYKYISILFFSVFCYFYISFLILFWFVHKKTTKKK